MGAMLSILRSDETDSCWDFLPNRGPSNKLPEDDILLDFFQAQPTEADKKVYDIAETLLENSQKILRDLESYQASKQAIAQALKDQTPKSEWDCWVKLQPCILKLKDFYDYSVRVNEVLMQIFDVIWPDSRSSNFTNIAEEILNKHQALIKQFAKILEFVLEFDEHKMNKEGIQNDFSYYRRIMLKMQQGKRSRKSTVTSGQLKPDDIAYQKKLLEGEGEVLGVDDMEKAMPTKDIAYSISFYFAHATPMLHTASNCLKEFVKARPEFKERMASANSNEVDRQKGVPGATLNCLKVMAKFCQTILERRVELEQKGINHNEVFVMRVLIGVIILFDHACETGVFAKSSGIDVAACVKAMMSNPEPSESMQKARKSLLKAIQYTTIHWKDKTTPKKTIAVIEAAAAVFEPSEAEAGPMEAEP